MASPSPAEGALFFNSSSASKPPGAGVHESPPRGGGGGLAGLAAVPDWRRVLSNFAELPPGAAVELSPRALVDAAALGGPGPAEAMARHLGAAAVGADPLWRFPTVEHAFQGVKCARRVAAFTVGGELGLRARGLGLRAGLPARQARKLVLLSPAGVAAWDALSSVVMGCALRARARADPVFRRALLATAEAQLWHGAGRGVRPARMLGLEAIRAELRAAGPPSE